METPKIARRALLAGAGAALRLGAAGEGWLNLFNGASLEGWRGRGQAGAWRVSGGTVTAGKGGAYLFYNGPAHGARFRNFELEVEALLEAGASAGIYFHTADVPAGEPQQGFRIQLNNTAAKQPGRLERAMTGSLYGLRNIYKPMVADNQWFKIHAAVRGKNIQVRLNGTLLVDYTEPTPPVVPPGAGRGCVLGQGTFALGRYDAGAAAARFRSVRVRPLPDDVGAPGAEAPVVDPVFREVIACQARNIPMVDYHVHLKGGLTIEDALRRSRKDGIQYGIAVNCGKGFPVQDDVGLRGFVDSMINQPVFLALQAEGREWMQLVSRGAVSLFDYVFTDSMTWSDDRGRRMRLWMDDEVGHIADPEEFMDTLVDRAAGILEREPIDIYVNPTFLPAQIAGDYDRLWTEERMRRLAQTAARNHVAIEINSRYRLPSPAFIRIARQAGCKFAFGTNNGSPNDLGRSEYGLKMVEECELDWRDFFLPGAWWPKAAERKRDALRA